MVERKIAIAVLLGMVANLVIASPLEMSGYPKFPDNGTTEEWGKDWQKYDEKTGASLRSFHSQLKNMKKAEQELKAACLDERQIRKMTSIVKGSQVLIWPERFKECVEFAKLLDEGTSATDIVILPYLNQKFSANYPPPRGDPSLIAQWNSIVNGIVNFGGGACDGASRKIILFGTPGFSTTPQDVFKQNKNGCPAQWRELFSEYSEKKTKTKQKCVNGIKPSSENGPDWVELCDSEKSANGDDVDKRANRKLEDELDLIEKGGYKQSGKNSGNYKYQEDALAAQGALLGRKSTLSAAMRESIQNQEEYQRKNQIFGGETGKLLEQAVGAVEGGSGCNDEQEAQATVRMQEPRAAQIQKLPQHQQACPLAQLYVDIYQRALAYAERCNRRDTIPAIRAELNHNQALVRQECNSAQSFSGRSRSGNSNGGSGPRNSESSRQCLQWQGSRTDPYCVRWSQ